MTHEKKMPSSDFADKMLASLRRAYGPPPNEFVASSAVLTPEQRVQLGLLPDDVDAVFVIRNGVYEVVR